MEHNTFFKTYNYYEHVYKFIKITIKMLLEICTSSSVGKYLETKYSMDLEVKFHVLNIDGFEESTFAY